MLLLVSWAHITTFCILPGFVQGQPPKQPTKHITNNFGRYLNQLPLLTMIKTNANAHKSYAIYIRTKNWDYTDSDNPSPKESTSSVLYIKGVWQPLDCFNNVSPRDDFALPELFDDKVSAKEKAEAFGFKIFGADNKNCWSGDDAENTYKKYGESKLCEFSRKTGHGSGLDKNGDVFVYKLAWGRRNRVKTKEIICICLSNKALTYVAWVTRSPIVWCKISNTENRVWPHFQTPRRELKTQRVATCFLQTSRCLKMLSETVLNVQYILSTHTNTTENTGEIKS